MAGQPNAQADNQGEFRDELASMHEAFPVLAEGLSGYLSALDSLPGIDRKTRSLVTLGMLTALNRPHEMAIHLEGAVNNGCTVEEIRETLTHTVAYCGFPAAIDALRSAEGFLRDKKLL